MNGTLPYTLGLSACMDGKEICLNLIDKDTILPTGVKHSFEVSPGAESVSMKFFTNEDKSAKYSNIADCREIGTMCFPLPAGLDRSAPLEAVVTVGLNGLLIVTLNIDGTRVEKTIDL